MKLSKSFRYKKKEAVVYRRECVEVVIQGEPELVLKVNEAITRETKTWKDIEEE